MSAKNGGRGTPPVPPPGHGPPEQEVQIPIGKEVQWASQETQAARSDDGGGLISFLVVDGGQPVIHKYLIGEPGKKRLLEELSGGLTLP